MVHKGGGGAHPLEVVETVLEVADVAWTALELHHHHHDRSSRSGAEEAGDRLLLQRELENQRAENQLLRSILQENTKIFEALQRCLSFPEEDCPQDLYEQLMATVKSSTFLRQLNPSVAETNNDVVFKEGEAFVNIELQGPSWWVWVTDEMAPNTVEELSGIDNESYVIVNEEDIVDGIANFIARCIVLNPKSRTLAPEELQRILSKALGQMNNKDKIKKLWHAGKLLYSLATWGIALAGLYRHRVVLKAAANGIGATGRVILKAL